MHLGSCGKILPEFRVTEPQRLYDDLQKTASVGISLISSSTDKRHVSACDLAESHCVAKVESSVVSDPTP